MLSLGPPAQGLENSDVCAVLDIVVFRGKRGPHVPSMAKPVARARWEFWFLVLIVIPFRKLKIDSLSLAGGALSLIPDAKCDVGLLLLPQSSCEASAPLWTAPYLILQDVSTQTSPREMRRTIRVPVHCSWAILCCQPAYTSQRVEGNVRGRSL